VSVGLKEPRVDSAKRKRNALELFPERVRATHGRNPARWNNGRVHRKVGRTHMCAQHKKHRSVAKQENTEVFCAHKGRQMSSSYNPSEEEHEQGIVRETKEETARMFSVFAKRLEQLEQKEEEEAKRKEQAKRYHARHARSRSRSPQRPSPPPREKPRSVQAAGCPIGYRRSSCKLNHACGNPRCYTSLRNPNIVWDKSKYARPYVPRW